MIFFLKLALAGILIYWPIREGKLDFSLFGKLIETRPEDWLLALLILIVISCLATYRWKCILEIKTKSRISYWQMIKVNWIGQLFNPILPGSVSGDVVKVWYAKDIDKSLSTDYLFSSIIIDRIFGFTSLVLVMGFASYWSWGELLARSPEMINIMFANIGIFVLFLGLIVFLLLPKRIQNPLQNLMGKIPWFGPLANRMIGHFWLIGEKRSSMGLCFAISIVCQMAGIFVFWFLSHPYFSSPFSLLDTAVIYPLGMIIVSIPITPLGLGVGHIAFDKLFGLYGISGGANFFNAYILTHTVNYVLGVFPYLLGRKRVAWKKIR